MLTVLGPYLPMHLLPQALDAAHDLENEVHRAEALTALVPHLPVDLLRQALDAAQDIGDEKHRAEAADSGLAPHLPEPLKGQACQRAWTPPKPSRMSGAGTKR